MAPNPRKSGPKSSESSPEPARFYAALVGLAEDADPRQTYRRQVLGLVQEIASRIRARGRESATTGYHASVHYILALLYRANPERLIKARIIQRALGYTAGGMTRRLDSMVRDGLIVRIPDPDDGRAWLARLTPQGEAAALELLSRADEQSRRLEESLTEQEWQALIGLLSRVGAEIK